MIKSLLVTLALIAFMALCCVYPIILMVLLGAALFGALWSFVHEMMLPEPEPHDGPCKNPGGTRSCGCFTCRY